MERKQIDAQYARAVYATVARPASHFDLDEPRLSQNALTQTLECVGRNAANDFQEGILPVTFIQRLNVSGILPCVLLLLRLRSPCTVLSNPISHFLFEYAPAGFRNRPNTPRRVLNHTDPL